MLVTKYVFENVDAVGRIEAAYTYDDEVADPRILSAWVSNQGAGPVRFKITRTSDGAVFTFDCAPGFQRELTFNNSQGQRLELTLTSRGPVPVSFGYEVQYPPHS
jgi:hypothetical protein